jgi:L-alanine-DL-glutamate epimerase-like enolase superfamily enzyme
MEESIQTLLRRAPFVASALACAWETWEEGMEEAYGKPVSRPIPLAAFCGGDLPEEAARSATELVGQGFNTLKMKIGRLSPDEDGQRVRRVAKEVEGSCLLRLDANQAYAFEDALAICREIEEIRCIELLEQPFKPDQWLLHERLAQRVGVPLMLDESIWTEEDVRRAADCGARLIKLKLCKHRGMQGSKALVHVARKRGLGVVYGNGVQTALGNHLEARVHESQGLTSACESNGFLKVRVSPISHLLQTLHGELLDGGVKEVDAFRGTTRPFLRVEFPETLMIRSEASRRISVE